MPRRSVGELIRIPPEHHDLPWLKESLQWAVELEFATIPVYLSGMWSIEQQAGEAYSLINSVVLEEMLHLGLAANMLAAIGGKPQITAPTYPGGLPGGVRPGLEVYLDGLNMTSVAMYMQIELPEPAGLRLVSPAETFPTIGAFYDAIAAAFKALSPAISTTGQISTTIGVPDPNQAQLPSPPELHEPLGVLATLADVQAAIALIRDQGEGTSNSPDAPQFDNGELAHYYRFGEIYNGRRYVEVDGKWGYTGDPVPFPTCYPVAKIPPGGYPGVADVEKFDVQFAALIGHLQSAWSGGGGGELGQAITIMMNLQPTYVAPIVTQAVPGGGGNYGPDFVVPTLSAHVAGGGGLVQTIGHEPLAAGQGIVGRATTVSFKADILPLFTSIDVAHMSEFGVSLGDYAYMSQPANAKAVQGEVASGTMPPADSGEQPWTAAQVALFESWIAGGMQP